MRLQKGDRVRLKASATPDRWWLQQQLRVGVYVGETRDGRCDKVQWPGTTKPQTINKGFIEVVEERSSAGNGHDADLGTHE